MANDFQQSQTENLVEARDSRLSLINYFIMLAATKDFACLWQECIGVLVQ